MTIRPASPADAARLTLITRRSKAHWGYDPAQLKAWEEELTIRAEYLQQSIASVALVGDLVVGYYSLDPLEVERYKLENLFVLPEYFGQGVGKALLKHALDAARQRQCRVVWLESDPHATDFYLHQGFWIVGQKPSSIPGRYLPVMELAL